MGFRTRIVATKATFLFFQDKKITQYTSRFRDGFVRQSDGIWGYL